MAGRVTSLAGALARYNVRTGSDIQYLPMSGLLGHNIKDKVPKNVCSWYTGPTLFELLDNAEPLPRDPLAPFRMSVIDRYKDMGTIAMGKSESGIVRKGDRLYVMPNKCVQTTCLITHCASGLCSACCILICGEPEAMTTILYCAWCIGALCRAPL